MRGLFVRSEQEALDAYDLHSFAAYVRHPHARDARAFFYKLRLTIPQFTPTATFVDCPNAKGEGRICKHEKTIQHCGLESPWTPVLLL